MLFRSEDDIQGLIEAGVEAIYTPGSSTKDIVGYIETHLKRK